ncbi:MAG: hypothetical protein O3A85_14560 [Proteobacteria bacterium]|nr:hypothetical protein [Pseudomonadota bacterium]
MSALTAGFRKCSRVTMTSIMALMAVLVVQASAGAAELIMFESAGCSWCRKWDADIAPAYPNTTESKCAPLRRVDLQHGGSGAVTVAAPVLYTPTFVIAEGGKEIGRVTGYAGEDFFWTLLQEQLAKLPEGCPKS